MLHENETSVRPQGSKVIFEKCFLHDLVMSMKWGRRKNYVSHHICIDAVELELCAYNVVR